MKGISDKVLKCCRTGLACLLILALSAGMTGCGGTEHHTDEINPSQQGEEGKQEGQKGRYLETENDLSDQLSYPKELIKRDDGSYVIYDQNSGFYVSTDEGQTWNREEKEWFYELDSSGYIMSLSLSPKGGAAYVAELNPPAEEVPETEESASEEESASDEEETEERYLFHPVFCYVDQDGNKLELDIPYTAENHDYIDKFYFSPEGDLYGAAMGGKIFSVNLEDGSSQMIYESDKTVSDIVFIGNRLMLCYRDDILMYQPETGETEQADSILKDFIMQETPEDRYDYYDSSMLLMMQGEDENTIYLAFNKGLYRYVFGESAPEQMIDGSLCTLGDPSTMPVDMVMLPDNRFMILYNNGRVIQYEYDETVSTVPENTITAYSLKENKLLRQAIVNYQKKDPNVYVRYEIGMDQDSGITKEDALKKLNTEIMAGKGPDVLLLDGFPVDSYVEKGILADISPYLNQDELLQNITELYVQDGKMYMMPAEFSVMMMTGDKDSLSKVKDLKSLADEAEALREKNPEGPLFWLYTEKLILMSLAANDMPAVVKEDGSVDEAALTEFLTQAKRIYQAESKGIEEEEIEEYRVMVGGKIEEDEVKYRLNLSVSSFNIAAEKCRLSFGSIGNFDWDLASVVSLKELKDKNIDFTAYQGMEKNVFRPSTMAAINARSEQQEIAGELLRTLFSEETQGSGVIQNFAVNKKAIQKSIDSRNGKDGEFFGGMSMSDDEGNYVSLEVRGANQEEIDSVMNVLESAKVPNFGYDVIEEAIYELGPDALNGSKSVEETVSEIMKKVAIYLSE